MTFIERTESGPVEITERKAMTPARRARILARQGPLCARAFCEEPWTEADHIVPLAMGGADKDHNVEGLCSAHHAEKTARDIRAIRKAQRLERDANPQTRRRPARPMRGRGFPKDPLRG